MKRIIALILNISLLASLFCFSAGATETKLVAITFDDGPSKYTDELLDGLERLGAKATFFMVGPNVSAYSDTVRRMKDEGHQLATHTMSHANLPTCSVDRIRSEVEGVNKLLTEIVGEGKFYLRPPYGAFNSTVKQTVKSPMIHWSLDTEDWRYRNATSVYNAILRNISDGDIILLHDLYKTSVEGALMAIEHLQKQGYSFVTVEQLLRRRAISPQDGVVYFDAPNLGITLPAVVEPVIAFRHTISGTKLVIGRGGSQDQVFFTDDGKAPDEKCSKYENSFYIQKELKVQALTVGDGELSEIVSADGRPRKLPPLEEMDEFYQRYHCPFLALKQKFVIGMKF